MPYIGVKVRNNNRLITVKLNGPDYEFNTTTEYVNKLIEEIVANSKAERSALADWVAIKVAEEVHEDDTVVWVGCEVMYADGSLYGGVSELVG